MKYGRRYGKWLKACPRSCYLHYQISGRLQRVFLKGNFKGRYDHKSTTHHGSLSETYQSTSHSGIRRGHTQCRQLALDVVQLYISLLSEFFNLSDIAVVASPGESRTKTASTYLPIHSNSLTTAHFLMKVLGEIQDGVNEINAIEISRKTSTDLRDLLENVRWKFEDTLVQAWQKGWSGPESGACTC